MKALLVLLLFFTTLSYSQSLGWTYSNSLLSVKNGIGSKYNDYKEESSAGIRYISAYLINDECTAEVYYFNDQNICFEVRLMYRINHINKFVEEMNINHSKISELKWKDYKTDVFYEVMKNDTYFALRIYK